MVLFTAVIKKFDKQGEKTGWSYIHISSEVANQLNPGVKKSYRVCGCIDQLQVNQLAMLPMGDGSFILLLNGSMRKALRKQKGAVVKVELDVDDRPVVIHAELIACLADEPSALDYFNSLPEGHRHYFSKWVESAKTTPTRTKRIAMAVDACSKKWNFNQMLHAAKEGKLKVF